MGELFDTILIEPFINVLMMLSHLFDNSLGAAIIAVTIIVNLIILPLTIRQTRSMKKMQTLQPKMQELQKKYSKDKQKQQQEIMKLYKEEGVNPIGCALPLIIQMPIIIALYQGIIQTLPTTPNRLIGLSKHIYDWGFVQEGVPPESNFLGLDLSQPNFFMVILIMASMWISQKMSTTPSADPKQQQMQQMMQWMMPLFLGFIFLSFPSGLALYIVVMTIFRMVVQRFITGNWGGIEETFRRLIPGSFPKLAPAGNAPSDTVETGSPVEDSTIEAPSEHKNEKETRPATKKSNVAMKKSRGRRYGSSGSKRKNRR
ncbi:MAG: YidC/Oxa1 family membrane protein insertase [Dehalococcoidia bacterium]